jgi:hypothetical protein
MALIDTIAAFLEGMNPEDAGELLAELMELPEEDYMSARFLEASEEIEYEETDYDRTQDVLAEDLEGLDLEEVGS